MPGFLTAPLTATFFDSYSLTKTVTCGIADVALLQQPRDQPLELALGQAGDDQPAEQRHGDRAVVGDADGLVQLLDVEDADLEQVLPADAVVGARASRNGSGTGAGASPAG